MDIQVYWQEILSQAHGKSGAQESSKGSPVGGTPSSC